MRRVCAEWGGVGERASLRRSMILARDRVAATRAVAYFLMVGGAVVGTCALLVPGFAGGTTAGVLATLVVGGASVLAGACCRVMPQRMPESFWVAVPVLGVLIIGGLNLATEDVSVSAHLYYLWPLLYAATFLRHDLAYLLLAAASVTDAAVTFSLQPFGVGVTDVAALVTAYCVLTVVVTKLRARADALVAMLEQQALSDPLTGLPNRRAFDRDLVAALDAARRTGAERCLLIIDVDHFKTINDTWGHATGDTVLVRVAAALREATAPGSVGATAARLGGDEFAVVVHGDVGGAHRIAALVRAEVARTSDLPDGLPTLSVGLASTRSGGAEPEALLAAADRALYDAKVHGRDRVSVVEAAPRRRPRTVPQP
ncbi:GGDEF domain-containing protein [Dactylosporangium aurantiacum]|uniref:GGDEF domain-containing protein n=1 Tax=Dactylosporangium aurantiacum TaxID=35754 RepID=A0A9Q9IDI5_9ACTN|nr:GGDEF domain-containing protein [Dactylosporangium aurantiacum]MDG6101695.1 GGDEF domain-containing protein [Dactylosporangium aurantiacum]UWZ52488.1 GGDEF domain-containing protein [Dactylosporangium aurantiacum]